MQIRDIHEPCAFLSLNRRVDHFHPTRYLSHLPTGIFYCMLLRAIITQRNFASLLQNTLAAVTSGLLTIVKTGLTFVSYFGNVTASLFALTIIRTFTPR